MSCEVLKDCKSPEQVREKDMGVYRTSCFRTRLLQSQL